MPSTQLSGGGGGGQISTSKYYDLANRIKKVTPALMCLVKLDGRMATQIEWQSIYYNVGNILSSFIV